MAQLWPLLGRKSVRVTAVEGPVPPAATTMVNPAPDPATIGVRSAVLSTLTSGHCTAMVAAVELLFRELVSLVEVTLAVLLMPLVRSAAVVALCWLIILAAPSGSLPLSLHGALPISWGEVPQAATL